MNNMAIATEILNQLGGNKFIAMTGAKDLMTIDCGVQFKVGRNSKGISAVRIILKADVYEMQFLKLKAGDYQVIASESEVYNYQLAPIFESQTGLMTKLF